MRRGTAKSKTENEKDAAPEGEETATQGNGDTVASASGGESDKEDKNTAAAAATVKKRKGKRGKKEESSPNTEDEAQNAEPEEKKPKRATRNVKSHTEETTEDQEEYEVEKIVDMKESRGKRLFKIHWKGYGSESDTWEEEQDLSCPELIKDFVSQLPNKGKKRNAKSTDSKTKKSRVSFSEDKEADQKEYEVAQVMEMKSKKNGKREFLVHWKGFSHDEDTWEPEENLNCGELIEEFMKKHKTSNTKAERKGATRASGKGKKAGRRNNKQKAAQNSE